MENQTQSQLYSVWTRKPYLDNPDGEVQYDYDVLETDLPREEAEKALSELRESDPKGDYWISPVRVDNPDLVEEF